MIRFALFFFYAILFTNSYSQTKKLKNLIANNFYPITQEEQSPFGNALSSVLADKTIIGFGEATHGTREFRLGFIKMAKDLIKNKGFNVVLLAECGFSDTYYLNEYVVYGRESSLAFNKNQTVIDEDFKEFAEWLRKYNSQHEESERVWMLGADILFLNSIALDALSLAEELNVSFSEGQLRMLSDFAFISDMYKSNYFKHRELDKLIQTADSIVTLINASAEFKELNFHQKRLLQSTSNLNSSIRWSEDWTINYPRFRSVDNQRDSSIFRNTEWIKKMKPDAKIIMFAHNAHIEKKLGHSLKLRVRLGHLLQNSHGEKYFAIATEAGRGEFFYQGEISQRKNRVGNILYKTNLPEGILLFKPDSKLYAYFSRKCSITYGVGHGTGNFTYLDNASEAFDAFYYFPISTPGTILASRKPFEEFVLNLTMSAGHAQGFIAEKYLTIKIETFFHPEGNIRHDQSISLSITFLSNEKQFVDFTSLRLTSGGLNDYNFKIPKNADSAVISIAGRGIKSLLIPHFEIDGVNVEANEVVFSSNEFVLINSDNKIKIEKGK